MEGKKYKVEGEKVLLPFLPEISLDVKGKDVKNMRQFHRYLLSQARTMYVSRNSSYKDKETLESCTAGEITTMSFAMELPLALAHKIYKDTPRRSQARKVKKNININGDSFVN